MSEIARNEGHRNPLATTAGEGESGKTFGYSCFPSYAVGKSDPFVTHEVTRWVDHPSFSSDFGNLVYNCHAIIGAIGLV